MPRKSGNSELLFLEYKLDVNDEHKQLLADYKALIKIGHCYDETGGFLPDESLPMLLEKPTKRMACSILLAYIEHWFNTGVEAVDVGRKGDKSVRVKLFINDYPWLYEIADRYDIEIK